MAQPPVLLAPIPDLVINEGAALGPINLNEYFQSETPLRFTAELENGASLPKGLICTNSGTLSGIGAANTQGEYLIIIVAENDSGTPTTAQFKLTIKERIAMHAEDFASELKSRVWDALGKDLPIPDIGDILNRPVTPMEVYWLLQRFATITIWDVYNLDPPGAKQLLQLEGCSKHYVVYDRGSCLVAAPKDLFSHERTLEDSLQAARAVAREAFKRGWVIEFAGFDKMVRAAWIELQLLSDKYNKKVEIMHYEPTEEDMKIYSARSQSLGLKI